MTRLAALIVADHGVWTSLRLRGRLPPLENGSLDRDQARRADGGPHGQRQPRAHPVCQQLVMLGRQSVVGEALRTRRIAGNATQDQESWRQRGEGAAHDGGSGSAIAEVRPQVAVGKARLGLADVQRSIVSRLA
jgi:hypothetical protein